MITDAHNASLLRLRIKNTWGDLSDDEIALHDTMRDMFFLAVKKKYALSRAEAEGILRDLDHLCDAEAS